MFHVPEKYRLMTGILASTALDGNNGVFEIPRTAAALLVCIASNGLVWEHLSCHKVITQQRRKVRKVPSWHDMCFAKDIFWDEEDCVIQYHPPKSRYVNDNPYVLHLWRPIDIEIHMPPRQLV